MVTTQGRVIVTTWHFDNDVRVMHFSGSDSYNITLGTTSRKPETYKVNTVDLAYETAGLGLNFKTARITEHRAN